MSHLSVQTIAATLEGIEETIIFKLIDRAQFKANPAVYNPGESGFIGAEGRESLFDLRLAHHEKMDALFGRFCAPEERPFCDNLPPPRRVVSVPDLGLRLDDYNRVNLTKEIKKFYLELVGTLCIPGDDQQYGSSVEHDVYALQALSRRIHYGAMYVAESKYISDPLSYQALIDAGDTTGLLSKLTRREVEENIIKRLRHKTEHAQAEVNCRVRRIIDADIICALYHTHVIPLTKQGEILYLMNRKPGGEQE
jgi:chorismate mutase